MPVSPSHKDGEAWQTMAIAILCGVIVGLVAVITMLTLITLTSVGVLA